MGASQKSQASGNWATSRCCLALLFIACVLLTTSSRAQPAGGLFTPSASFNLTNHLVSVSVFQWFTASGGQLTGPWRPVEGRSNWTGTTGFWRTQIKQMMAANFDMLYVHLIPSSEEQRVNLFQALNQLRREGWNVPKVAPFLDPPITWDGQPLVDVGTAAGKDTFVNQYIRWFNQYYSVNQDAYADDYLARINNRPVLDTWHVFINLTNITALTRADVETRLKNTFAASHPPFSNGIYQVTTALNGTTFAWADEKVPQFEINQYGYSALWHGIQAVQLKAGYWDQNIRNPGDFLPRAGGVHYSNTWNHVNRSVHRHVYVESWNEYDEGTGIYAANAGPPYIKPGSGNANTDTWSAANDPYEYIKTTARGAAAFNDWPEREAKILWHNIPSRMLPGETRTATVIVRNEGDALWSEAAKYRFGQKEFLDPVLFGPGRYKLNDTQDDIPTYGGIFRGRPKTFTLSVKAPPPPGLYTNHWSMVQENVAWFGEELVWTILVDPAPVYHGVPQAIDSTGLFTNRVEDFTEHTYVTDNLPVGSFADCAITRTFAAPIKSLKLSIVSGAADDIGYVGGILVTADSANTTCRLGHVTNVVNVRAAVTLSGNEASLTLRAKDTCCCQTGWGEDTAAGRLNARLHWEVELSPPVPTSTVFNNEANGHFYVLLSPATWSWSERAAVELGGHLATINNQTEQNWVFNTLAAYGGVGRLLWIGFNDVANEGTFRWSSGETPSFTFWAPGEPNNALGGEDFVTMYQPGHTYPGRWNDWGERVLSGSRPFNGVVELAAAKGPPVIERHPFSQRVNLGDTAIFPVLATGSRLLQYQWRFNGVNIGWATNADLVLTNVQYNQAGDYSVLVSDALTSVASSNATLFVNHPPVANPQTVSLDEDTIVPLSLAGFDTDGDVLTFAVVTPPAHGSLTGTVPNLIYRPATNFNGLDAFSFSVNDGMTNSFAAIVNLTIRPVNDPPGAYVQSVSVSEDALSPITLAAFDVDDDLLIWSIVSPPAYGSLSGAAPNLTYLAATNYFGPDSFSFKVNDGQLDSAPAAVSITVLPVNDAPEPKIVVSPLTRLPGFSNLLVIAPVCHNARVILDGSQSSDVENDPLQYAWTEGTNTLGTTATVTNQFAPGNHTVTLVVNDGTDSVTATTIFAVLTPAEATRSLALAVREAQLGRRDTVPLLVTLHAAADAFERCRPGEGSYLLNTFQHEVHDRIAPQDPTLAKALTDTAVEILEIVSGAAPGDCRVVFHVVGQSDGKTRVEFSAPKSQTYFVEASTNLMDWEFIGVAEARGDGTFLFEDPSAGKHPRRFYRVLSP